MPATRYHGSCHCGVIAFEADIDFSQGLRKCNCTFCRKFGYQKALVPDAALRIVSDRAGLSEYLPTPSHWPAGDIHHYYCQRCGAHPFSRGYLEKEMGGHFWAVNVACLDDASEAALASAPLIYEDGLRDRQDRVPEITGYL